MQVNKYLTNLKIRTFKIKIMEDLTKEKSNTSKSKKRKRQIRANEKLIILNL